MTGLSPQTPHHITFGLVNNYNFFFLVPGMSLLAIFLVLGTALATGPAHLKPRALTAHLGRAYLVEDVLWVTYPFPSLVTIPDNLCVIAKELDAVLSQMISDSNDDSSQIISLLRNRLTYVNHSLTDILDSYGGLTSHRAKRRPINGLGQLSRMLFGTAMDEDVVELRQKFNSLIAYAPSQSKVITLNSHHIQRIEQHLVDIHLFTHRLVASFNSAMNTFNKLLFFEQALSALESSVSSLLHTNGILIQNIVDASRSRVTSTLFPVKDFLHVLA